MEELEVFYNLKVETKYKKQAINIAFTEIIYTFYGDHPGWQIKISFLGFEALIL